MRTIQGMTFSKNRVKVTYRTGNVITHIETSHATAVRESGRCSNCGNDTELIPMFQHINRSIDPYIVDWVCCE